MTGRACQEPRCRTAQTPTQDSGPACCNLLVLVLSPSNRIPSVGKACPPNCISDHHLRAIAALWAWAAACRC
jgi:hypothetical protein